MSRMLKTHRNTIVNTMITLLFVSGCLFLLSGNWDAAETEDVCSSCGADAITTSTCGCCDGSIRLSDADGNRTSDIPQKHSEVNIYQ